MVLWSPGAVIDLWAKKCVDLRVVSGLTSAIFTSKQVLCRCSRENGSYTATDQHHHRVQCWRTSSHKPAVSVFLCERKDCSLVNWSHIYREEYIYKSYTNILHFYNCMYVALWPLLLLLAVQFLSERGTVSREKSSGESLGATPRLQRLTYR